MPPSYDIQSNPEYLVSLPSETLRVRYELLQTILEDIDTFASIVALRRDLSRWKHTHLIALVARELLTGSLSTVHPQTDPRTDPRS